MITFNELKEMQPRLGQLEAHAITLGKSSLSYIQRDRVWYQGLKDEMVRLVGFDSTVMALQYSSCYDVTYQHLINILKI